MPQKALVLTGFGVLAGLLAMSSRAQETGDAKVVLDEVEVVLDEVAVYGTRLQFRVEDSAAATKIEMPVKDTPQAVTIFSDELLRAASIRNTADAADFVPGLQEAGNIDGTEIALSSRGFDVSRDRGYKINGLVTNAELDLDYAAVERLEVIRGPASVIYGEVDYGATVNRVLKSPTRVFQATTTAELGSFDARRMEVDVGGPFSDTTGGRVVTAYQDADAKQDFVHSEAFMVAPSFVWRPTEASSVGLHAYYQSVKGNSTDGFGVLPDNTIPNVPRSAYLGADFNRIDTQNRFVTLEYDQRLGAGFSLSVKAAYSNIRMDNLLSFISSDQFAADEGAPLDDEGNPVEHVEFDGRAPVVAFPEPKDKRDTSFDITLAKAFMLGGREHTLAISGDTRKQRNLDTGSDFLPVGVVNLFDPRPIVTTPEFVASLYNPDFFFRQDLELSGLSLLALLKPLDRVNIVAGLRYTSSDSSDEFGGVFEESKAHDTIGRLGVVYRLSEDWSTYASWSEGIIFNSFMADINGRNIEPERGEQIELGIKGDVLEKRATFAAALFRIERTDSATFLGTQSDPPFDSIFANVGRQDHVGLELELLGEIVPGLNLVASYVYLDVDVKEAADPAQIGRRPADAPRASASAFLTYVLPQVPGLSLGGGFVYRSERELDAVGTAQFPSYTRFDLRAAYDISDHWFAEFSAKNITDEEILVSNFDLPGQGIFYVDPRSYSVRMTYRY